MVITRAEENSLAPLPFQRKPKPEAPEAQAESPAKATASVPSAAAVKIPMAAEFKLAAPPLAEPKIEPTVWSTAALNIAPGANFQVPLLVDEVSRCTYSFKSSAEDMPVGFRIGSEDKDSEAYVDLRLAASEGSFETVGGGVLFATLDNATMMTTATVEVKVSFEPLRQIAALETARKQALLRATYETMVSKLEKEEKMVSAKLAEQAALEEDLEVVLAKAMAARQALSAKQAQVAEGNAHRSELVLSLSQMRSDLS